jgi:hypothetical protein
VAIHSASSSPTWRGDHRAAEKNRCARPWCHIWAKPAPVSIPHTVRLTGCPNNPATIIVNVSKVGAVKHGRKVASAPGRVGTRSIGGTLFRLRQSCYKEPPMLHQQPHKIHTTRRRTVDFLATAPPSPPGRTHEKCESRVIDATQNSVGGSALGVFYNDNRVLAHDPFTVVINQI